MMKEYYHIFDGSTIRKTITQDLQAQKFIEKHLADFTKKTDVLDFHNLKNRTVCILTSELNIGDKMEEEKVSSII